MFSNSGDGSLRLTVRTMAFNLLLLCILNQEHRSDRKKEKNAVCVCVGRWMCVRQERENDRELSLTSKTRHTNPLHQLPREQIKSEQITASFSGYLHSAVAHTHTCTSTCTNVHHFCHNQTKTTRKIHFVAEFYHNMLKQIHRLNTKTLKYIQGELMKVSSVQI